MAKLLRKLTKEEGIKVRNLRAQIISKKVNNEDYSELENELNAILIEIGIEEG
jgi:hypothetical protein